MGGKVKWQYYFIFVGKRREIKGVVQVIKEKIGKVIDKIQDRHGERMHGKMLNVTDHQGNADPNHSHVSSHTCQSGYYQKDNKQVLARIWRKGNTHALLVGM